MPYRSDAQKKVKKGSWVSKSDMSLDDYMVMHMGKSEMFEQPVEDIEPMNPMDVNDLANQRLPEWHKSNNTEEIFEEGENQYTLLRVDRIYPETRKELKEARGEVLNDYQNHLEEKWVEELRETYAVKINKRNYKELKSRLDN